MHLVTMTLPEETLALSILVDYRTVVKPQYPRISLEP